MKRRRLRTFGMIGLSVALHHGDLSAQSMHEQQAYAELKLGLLSAGIELGMMEGVRPRYFFLSEFNGFLVAGSWVNYLIGVKYYLNEHWFVRPATGIQVDRPWNAEWVYGPAISTIIGYEWRSDRYLFGFDLLGGSLRYNPQNKHFTGLAHIPQFKVGLSF